MQKMVREHVLIFNPWQLLLTDEEEGCFNSGADSIPLINKFGWVSFLPPHPNKCMDHLH